MTRKLFSLIFLIAGLFIVLGAFGHASATPNLHAALDKFPIDPHTAAMIYLVWYFVSGCMLLFGVAIVWIWLLQKRGREAPLFIATLIGVLYVAAGIGGWIYRPSDSFMAVFIILGGLLVLSSYVLRPQH